MPDITIDWTKKLREDEIGKDKDVEFVYLKGLRRLSKEAGLCEEHHVIAPTTILTMNKIEIPFVQVQYTAKFKDGTIFSDCGDAWELSTQDIFRCYLTPIAANRAEARTIRKALGISLVAKEELGANPEKVAEFKNESTTVQHKVIKNLMKTRGIANQSELIKIVCKRDDVFDVDDFTFQEAQMAIKHLNGQKVKE